MAESKTSTLVPLNGRNYPTWKLQCRMALVCDGLWNIVAGTEKEPDGAEAAQLKFRGRRDRVLATVVLSIDPSLLYLIGADPKDPVAVWGMLQSQFQRKTWANKLSLRRRLHSLHLRDGDSIQDHIKSMTELFNELAVVGDAIADDDKVVYLLASLPELYNTLVTALEANEKVPDMEVVVERLLHTERKHRERSSLDYNEDKALIGKQQFPHRQKGRGPQCHYCKRYGHIQKNCADRIKNEGKDKQDGYEVQKGKKPRPNKVGLLTCHVLAAQESAHNWIVDSGATCHISNTKELFEELQPYVQKIVLGDGRTLEAVGTGVVELKLKIPNGETKIGRLSDVLYVPTLSYNLLSIPKTTEAGNTAEFTDTQCELQNSQGEVVAVAFKAGGLYYLNCEPLYSHVNVSSQQKSKEELWHRRFGHLGMRNMNKLKKSELVDGFDYDVQEKLDFCELCVSGKIHRNPFPKSGRERATESLGIVHSDVCGKISSPSLGQAEYFVVFIDDKTHYVWISVVKHKHEVFQSFLEWKALAERSSGYKVKKFRTDNGGEYTSTEFEEYLKKEGIEHQYTIPKTPQQNGVSERMNRTLVETVRSMLHDSGLPHRFWAEALSTAAYLINRSPTTTLHDMTPFEAWYNKKPNVSHLRVFGCSGFVHIPEEETRP